MPRLVGKTSYSGLYSTLAIAALALGVATGLEYLGYIDVVPGFGNGSRVVRQDHRSQRSIAPNDGKPLLEHR